MGKKHPLKSVAPAMNDQVNNSVAWHSVSNTGEQNAASGDKWHDMVSCK